MGRKRKCVFQFFSSTPLDVNSLELVDPDVFYPRSAVPGSDEVLRECAKTLNFIKVSIGVIGYRKVCTISSGRLVYMQFIAKSNKPCERADEELALLTGEMMPQVWLPFWSTSL